MIHLCGHAMRHRLTQCLVANRLITKLKAEYRATQKTTSMSQEEKDSKIANLKNEIKYNGEYHLSNDENACTKIVKNRDECGKCIENRKAHSNQQKVGFDVNRSMPVINVCLRSRRARTKESHITITQEARVRYQSSPLTIKFPHETTKPTCSGQAFRGCGTVSELFFALTIFGG